ncbi:unnamed protein product [Blepharisma stoltei]|uniref:Uncharacterized protein n=1 Tax=Blepharisma stoltei TaxID=1481888 RepID=A0AAU9KD62_9CILI|nr:unnamed protein product [Blepharisma stoltei]
MRSIIKLFQLILLSYHIKALPSFQKNSIFGFCTDMKFKYIIDGKICAERCPSQFIEESSPFAKCNLPVSPKLFELEFWKAQDLSAPSIQSSNNHIF